MVFNDDSTAEKSGIRKLLPPSAATVIFAGKSFVALPEQDVDDWLADLVDAIEAALCLTYDYPQPSSS